MKKTIIVAVAGGSGSGKTTFARMLYGLLGEENCAIIGQDSYYHDQSDKFDQDGGKVNFDHPDALDFDLLAKHLSELIEGREIDVPEYDFSTHKRKQQTHKITPHPVILVDGILILSVAPLLPFFAHKIFLDVPEDVRYERRLHRDVNERGRTGLGVFKQFYSQVKPMHDQFVEPSKKEATLLVTMDTFIKDLNKFADRIREEVCSLNK